MRLLLGLAATGLTLGALGHAFAQSSNGPDGYLLKPELAYKNITHDPDGIWAPANLAPFGDPPRMACLFVARTKGPAGTMILSVADSTCSPQNDCSFMLSVEGPGKKRAVIARGRIKLGGTAVVSKDLSTITTETSQGTATFTTNLQAPRSTPASMPGAGS